MEGVGLISERDLNKDRANQLHAQEAEHSPPLVEPPLLPWSSWVAFALGTLQTSGERGKKDAYRAYLFHISVTIDVTAEEAEALTTPVLRHMEQNRHRWHFVKEDDPLQYSVLLNDFYEEVHGYRLEHLDYYMEWIKPCRWCHKVILEREQLNYCTHLTGVEPPPDDVERPSESTLHSHRAAYKTAKWSETRKTPKRARSTLLETLTLHRLEDEYYYIIGGEKGPPPKNSETVPMEVCNEAGVAASQGGGDAPLGHKQVSWEE